MRYVFIENPISLSATYSLLNVVCQLKEGYLYALLKLVNVLLIENIEG